MATGYQPRVTYFKMLCSICMDMWIRGYAVENTSRIVSVIRRKHFSFHFTLRLTTLFHEIV